MADEVTGVGLAQGARRAQRRGTAAMLLLLCGAAAIGFAPILFRWSQVGASATAAWRLLLAAPLLLGAMARPSPLCRRVERLAARDLLVLAVPGLLFAGDLGFWHQSLARTSVANATLFTNCAPIFVVLAGWLWLKERFGRLFVPGLLLAIAGVAVMARTNPQAKVLAHSLLGDAMGIVSAMFYGGYQLAVKRLRGRFSTVTVMAFTSAVGGAVLMAAAAAAGEKMLAATLAGWAVLAALALLVQIGGQGLIVYALGHLPASFASVSLLSQVVVAAAAGWLLLAEKVSLWQALGGALVLAGIYLARQGSRDMPGNGLASNRP